MNCEEVESEEVGIFFVFERGMRNLRIMGELEREVRRFVRDDERSN